MQKSRHGPGASYFPIVACKTCLENRANLGASLQRAWHKQVESTASTFEMHGMDRLELHKVFTHKPVALLENRANLGANLWCAWHEQVGRTASTPVKGMAWTR